MEKILVSACLLGRPVRYDGGDKAVDSDVLAAWTREGRVVPLCPEMEAGLSVPRRPAEITKGQGGEAVLKCEAVIQDDLGHDVTPTFLAGAHRALEVARSHGCRYALLTDGSPSCGSSFVYDGSFSGTKIAEQGVVAALLRQAGVEVFSESQIPDLAHRLDERTDA